MAKFIDKYLSMIVIIAIIAVILSRRSSTVDVLRTLSSAMTNILGSIVAPISSGAAKAAAGAKETQTNPQAGTVQPPSGPTQGTTINPDANSNTNGHVPNGA